jgi:hypothetical protein
MDVADCGRPEAGRYLDKAGLLDCKVIELAVVGRTGTLNSTPCDPFPIGGVGVACPRVGSMFPNEDELVAPPTKGSTVGAVDE